MAELLDWSDKAPEEDNPDVVDISKEEPKAPPPAPEPVTAEDNQEELPEKYRGKSIQDLVKMHQEAEKAIGRSGSEVGELRKVVDEYIRSQTKETQAPPQPEATDTVDWFDDPDKALEQRLANDPRLKQLEQDRLTARREGNLATLERKHPDYKEVLQDNAFAEWVMGSKVRTKLFLEADQNYDADAADELLSTWKERKQLTENTVKADKASRKEQVKEASTGGASGSGEPSRVKKFRRADVIKLMNTDPERYAMMADEILQAYAEGRVI